MKNKNIALITGVTGQDGSYLSEFLLAKGYEVHGIIRRSSVDFRERIAHLEGTPTSTSTMPIWATPCHSLNLSARCSLPKYTI